MNICEQSAHLVARFAQAQSSVVVAGHYCLAQDMQELSHDGVGEAASFALGARVVTRMLDQGKTSRLVLWINDIGVEPALRNKIKNAYRLPCNYRSILDGERTPAGALAVCFESTMRNKASTLLRKLYRRFPQKFTKVDSASADLVRCVGDASCDIARQNQMAYTIVGPDGEQLVVKDGPNPKCNLILASLFADLSKKYRPDIHINIFNELYSYRIGLGLHVFRTLLANSMSIANVFCDGSRYVMDDDGNDAAVAADCRLEASS